MPLPTPAFGPPLAWSRAFKALHQVHQWFHVVLGPCTALCHNLPTCDSDHCELLLPLHAAYDMLARAWSAAHPAKPPCTEDREQDFDLDTCLPFVTPLQSVRDECEARYDALPYEYEHLQHWVAPAAQHERGAARGPGQENRTGLESL